MKTVIIDNYDSFTYNLSHLVKELGAEVTVMRNDSFKLEELKVFDKNNSFTWTGESPLKPDYCRMLSGLIQGKKPILGVVMGEQVHQERYSESTDQPE